MRPLLLAALLLTACDRDDSAVEPTDADCAPDAADGCCPEAGSGIDCMPAISECTLWKLDNCDIYCASF